MKILVITAEKLEYEESRNIIGVALNKDQADKIVTNFFSPNKITKIEQEKDPILWLNYSEIYEVNASSSIVNSGNDYPYNVLVEMEWHNVEM